MKMPDWVRDLLIALGAFIGGKAWNAAGERIKEGQELRRGVDRLAIAVEGIGGDLRDIRSEIHSQVAGLKIELHDQVSSLRLELNSHQEQQESRMGAIDVRIDALNRCKHFEPGPGFSGSVD